MSNIESNIVDPAKAPSPDLIVPAIDPEGDLVGSDEIQEPDDDTPAIEPDPEEGRTDLPPILRSDRWETIPR